jgi:signal peptidase I
MITITNLLRRQKSFRIKSYGSSMLPILLPGDVVYYQKTSFKQYRVDDIVMIRQKQGTITHRVIYKNKKFIITKGDNNFESDGKIYPKQIIGKVYQVKRSGTVFSSTSLYLLQSTLYFQEIIKIKKAFEQEKIDHVFLKGLPLHLYFEKTHPRRIYLDCDVLVASNDFSKAEKILKKFNYKKADTSLISTQKKLKEKGVENAYFKVINGFLVVFDLHLEPLFLISQIDHLEALYPQKLINQLTNKLLKTKKNVSINEQKFFILDSKYLILYLAHHFSHHNFHGAFRLNFINTIIKKSKLSNKNWLEMIQITNQYQLRNFVYPTFKILQKYFNTKIPYFYLACIKPSNFYAYKRIIKINIFDDEARITAGINRFKLIFLLSPQPLWRRLTVFFHPQAIYFIFWALGKKLSSFFSNQRANPPNPS